MLIKGSMEKSYGLRPVFAPELQTSYALNSPKSISVSCIAEVLTGQNRPVRPSAAGPDPCILLPRWIDMQRSGRAGALTLALAQLQGARPSVRLCIRTDRSRRRPQWSATTSRTLRTHQPTTRSRTQGTEARAPQPGSDEAGVDPPPTSCLILHGRLDA